VAGSGHARTCPAVAILEVTQQEAAQVRCRCRVCCIRLGCTLALPVEYDWTFRGCAGRCGLMSSRA